MRSWLKGQSSQPPVWVLKLEFAKEFGLPPWQVDECPDTVWEEWLTYRWALGQVQREEMGRLKRGARG